LLQAKIEELEAAKEELAWQNAQLMGNRTAVEFERRRYEELFNFAPDGYIVTDLDGLLQEINVEACRILGRPAKELQGVPLIPLFSAATKAKVLETIFRIRKAPAGSGKIEAALRAGEGPEESPCELRVNVMREQGKGVIGLRWILRDITEAKRAEDQQRLILRLLKNVNRAKALSEIYEAAVDSICECLGANRASILIFDEDEVMRFKFTRGLSAEYCRAVEGHSPWKANEREPQPICVEDVRLMEGEEHLRATILGEGIRSLAFIPLTYKGRLLGKFMVYYDTPHRFTSEELGLADAIAGPVSFAVERRSGVQALAQAKMQLEEHARNLEKAVAERTASLQETIGELQAFSYSLSHDMRAPLRAMRSFSEILQTHYAEKIDEEGKDLLQRIMNAAGRLDRLIQDVLAYSRITLSPTELEPLDVGKLLNQIIQEHPAFQEPLARMEAQTPLLRVLGHEASLTQCIYNLLSNAVKFVEKGKKPQVRIWSEACGSQVKIWFEDNGIGIPAEARERIFVMFQRLHRTEEYEGTGMGLAIVRKAAERMCGKAGIEHGAGGGSRFWLLLDGA
jgi:PAS domain S-box-containing protein